MTQPGRDVRTALARALDTPQPAGIVEWQDGLLQSVASIDDIVRNFGAELRLQELSQVHAGAGSLATTLDPFSDTSWVDVPPETEAPSPEDLQRTHDWYLLGWGVGGSGCTAAALGASTASGTSPDVVWRMVDTNTAFNGAYGPSVGQFFLSRPQKYDTRLWNGLRLYSTASIATTITHVLLIAMMPKGMIPPG